MCQEEEEDFQQDVNTLFTMAELDQGKIASAGVAGQLCTCEACTERRYASGKMHLEMVFLVFLFSVQLLDINLMMVRKHLSYCAYDG